MFAKVHRLILNAAFSAGPLRTAEQVQEDILHRLGTLKRMNAPPHKCEHIVEPAIRFVSSSAWSIFWARICHEYGWGKGLSREELTANETALRQHFEPFEELREMPETIPTADPTPAPTPKHPILQQLLAQLGPIVMQFLLAYLSKLTPAQAVELHAAACKHVAEAS